MNLGYYLHNIILKVEEPAVRSGGRKVADVDELINVLKDEVGII